MGKPEIRFKGYTDEWEQRKLIEVCDYVDYRGKTPTKTENGIFLVTAKNVKDGFIDYETSKEYISENAYEEVMRRGKPEIGDVLITTEAPCGNVAQVNKADIALAQRIIKYRGHIGVVDNTYLKYYLLSPEFQKILNAKSSGGTVQGIKGSILHQQKIIYPSYEEQKKIGQHMDSLDHLITLHQRKCDEVKSLKKYMLQKMFPQNEQKVPEIRFEGFTEAWEQRKLIEVCDYVDYRGKTPTKTENGIFLVTAKNVKDGFIDYETSKEYISENAYEEVMRRGKPEIGDVLITTEAPCGNVAQVNKADIALAQRIIKYRGHIGVVDNTYLKYYLLSPEFQKILNAKSSGGTVQGIKGSILHQQKIIYPSYEEQKKIGQHMDSLDHLITLHQQKCEELKKIKKFMLQKMFV